MGHGLLAGIARSLWAATRSVQQFGGPPPDAVIHGSRAYLFQPRARLVRTPQSEHCHPHVQERQVRLRLGPVRVLEMVQCLGWAIERHFDCAEVEVRKIVVGSPSLRLGQSGMCALQSCGDFVGTSGLLERRGQTQPVIEILGLSLTQPLVVRQTFFELP